MRERRHIPLDEYEGISDDSLFNTDALKALSQEYFNPESVNLQDALCHEFASWIASSIGEIIDQFYPFREPSDSSVYTGLAGIALMLLKMWRNQNRFFQATPRWHNRNALEWSDIFVHQALSMEPHHLDSLHRIGFYCSLVGTLAISSAVDIELGRISEAKKSIDLILAIFPNLDIKDVAWDVFNGLAGYLYTLRFIQSEIQSLPDFTSEHQQLVNVIPAIVDMIVQHGKEEAGAGTDHGIWTWHSKIYLGAAHGIAGILAQIVQSGWFSRHYRFIHATFDFVERQKRNLVDDPSITNYPSSLGHAGAPVLSQFCHGAPGFIPLFARLIKQLDTYIDKNPLMADELRDWKSRVQESLCEAIKVTFKRGWLTKGVGICHGISGTIYALLSAIPVTQSLSLRTHLKLAITFLALKCMNWERDTFQRRIYRLPDRPFSLMEGLAGAVSAMMDILQYDQDGIVTGIPGFADI